MDIHATNFKAFLEGDDLRISFFLGRNSKYKDKIVNIHVPEKEADKFLEELMRVIWERKINS